MKGKFALSVLATLGMCGGAVAQDYFDFDGVSGLPDQPSVRVDLNGALLGMAAAAAGANAPLVAEALSDIEGIRVRAYPKPEDAAAIVSFIDNASSRLETEGWERLVYAEEDGSNVRVYARMEGDLLNGLAIMAVSEDGAALVNVAGRITAEQLGRLVASLQADDLVAGIPQLGFINAPD